MKREDLLKSPSYWTGRMQVEIYQKSVLFMTQHNMNRTEFAAHLGVSKGYVTQILNGDCNFSIEKLCELATKLGYVPEFEMTEMESYISMESHKYNCVCLSTSVFRSNEKVSHDSLKCA